MKTINTCLLLIFSLMLLIPLGCSNDNNTAIVVINLGLTQQAHHFPFFDKILHFLMSPVYAAPPTNISDITVTITASDFSPITKNYSPPFGVFKIEVPSGIQRTIEVLANTPSATLRGVAIVDLEPGEQSVDIYMHLYQTKIIIPDYNNYRLVQIDDMDGSGFIAINAGSIGFSGTFAPYDVDFDDIGRIYIANYASGYENIIRINDATSSSSVVINTADFEISTVAVDRIRNYIYFADWQTLYRCNLDGSNLKQDFDTGSMTYFEAISVDDNGNLFISCYYPSDYSIVKFNPNIGNGQIIAHSPLVSYKYWDVIFKNAQCIAAYDDTSGLNDAIVILNTSNLTIVNQYGTGTTNSNPLPGQFWGPRRFVAILNENFYLIDEGVGDNLVSFSNLNFENWQRYADSFTFFSYC
ncbi:MAG: hypothetical protein AB1444_12810 [Spirochaetota bacterium]